MMLDSLLSPGSAAVIGASPDPHRTEAGGVRRGIADAAGLEAASDAIMASTARHAPDAGLPALARLIALASQAAHAGRAAVAKLELSPVIVHPAGQGCTVADVLPVLSPTGAEGA